MKNPLVSICIPTFNRQDYIVQTIQSALDQDYENFEIIVSDNCSTDNTQDLIKPFLEDSRFHYYRNDENVGMVNNWKLTLDSRVKGEWFILLSDDDFLINKSYISQAVNLINQHNINLVYSNGYIEHTTLNFKEKLNLPYSSVEDGKKIFLTSHKVKPQAFTLCNIMFKTVLAKKFNAFSNVNNLCCDSELFLKTCLTGGVGVVHDYSSVYRFHGDNLITQKRTYNQLLAIATDVLVGPYLMAIKSEGFEKAEMDTYYKQVVLSGLKDILFCVSELNPRDLSSALRVLSDKGVNIKPAFYDPIFLLKIGLTYFPFLLGFSRKMKRVIRKR